MRRKLPGWWRTTKGWDPGLDAFMAIVWTVVVVCLLLSIASSVR